MSRYRFELAEMGDDAQLRRVLAETPMDGDVSLSFRREPNYFDAAVVGGEFVQTVVGRDSSSGDVIGFGVRSVREMFVNGRPTPIGYLSSLRVLPGHRNLGLVARGYRYFAELHNDGRTPIYLTTIAEGNDRAVSVLTGGRAGLPPYHDAGRYFTLVVPSKFPRTNGDAPTPGITIRQATPDDSAAIVDFLNEHGPRRQFFPRYERRDLFQPRCTFRDLEPRDILLATREGRIVGTLGLWDQHRFRQSVVHRYSRRIRWARPLYQLWARLRGVPRLPPVGTSFRYTIAAVPVVADDDAEVCAELLRVARQQVAETASRHLLIGLHETDPLLPIYEKQAVTRYVTRLHVVCWPDGDALRLSLDGRPPYLELGTL